MYQILSQTFNPDILYVADFWNKTENLKGMHRHDFIEISIILEGHVEYIFNNSNQMLRAGQVLLFNPGVAHSKMHPKNSRSRELHIGLSNITVNGLDRNIIPITNPLLNLGDYHGKFLKKAWELSKEYNDSTDNYELMGKGIIIELLTIILRAINHGNSHDLPLPISERKRNKQLLANQAIYYLENNYTDVITLESLANQLFISSTQLSKVFREITGISPINYLIEIRLKRARHYLMHTDLSIKEIAASVGYQDASYFSKLFKKSYGTAPAIMKKHMESKGK